jgi:hypothetical protein
MAGSYRVEPRGTAMFRRILFLGFCGSLLVGSSVFAQTPSVEADVKLALKNAVRKMDADPAAAAAKLRQLLDRLTADHSLPADRRDELVRVIRDRLRIAEQGSSPGAVAATEASQKARDEEASRRAEESAKLKVGIREAIKLEKTGRSAEAKARVDELLKQHRDDPIVQAVSRADEVKRNQSEVVQTRVAKERAAAAGLSEIDRAAFMPSADLTISKEARARVAARKVADAPTAQELKILQSLNAAVPVAFRNTALQDAVDYIGTMMGMTVVLDKAALDDLRLTYTTPVTFEVKKPITARSALRGVIGPLGLTYVVVDGVVLVTTPARAREFMKVKVYDIAGLVQLDWWDADPRFRMLNAMMLIDTIVNTIDPESWEQRGGPGVIRYNDATRSLVVRQSAEIQISIKGSLSK